MESQWEHQISKKERSMRASILLQQRSSLTQFAKYLGTLGPVSVITMSSGCLWRWSKAEAKAEITEPAERRRGSLAAIWNPEAKGHWVPGTSQRKSHQSVTESRTESKILWTENPLPCPSPFPTPPCSFIKTKHSSCLWRWLNKAKTLAVQNDGLSSVLSALRGGGES